MKKKFWISLWFIITPALQLTLTATENTKIKSTVACGATMIGSFCLYKAISIYKVTTKPAPKTIHILTKTPPLINKDITHIGVAFIFGLFTSFFLEKTL